VPGQRNVFTTTADFTGIAFLTEAAGSLPDLALKCRHQPH
jgi:hypothetical protein